MGFFDSILSLDPILGAATQPQYGGAASRANKAAQAQIDRGMAMINAIYGGGSYPEYTKATGTYDPTASYLRYTKAGQYAPVKAGKGAKAFKKGQLYTMAQSPTFAGFTPDFYNKYAQSYVDYAMPQVGDQYTQAYRTNLQMMADRGLLGGSAFQQSKEDLASRLGSQERQVVDVSRAQANQMKAAVEAAKQQNIQQLYTTADPASAALSAIGTTSILQQPSAFAPITNAFADVMNQYYTNQLMQSYQTPGFTSYSPGSSAGYMTDYLPRNY